MLCTRTDGKPNSQSMIVKFKKLSADAVTPTKAHPSDAGYDLTAVSRELITEQGEDTSLAQALRHVEQQEHQALL